VQLPAQVHRVPRSRGGFECRRLADVRITQIQVGVGGRRRGAEGRGRHFQLDGGAVFVRQRIGVRRGGPGRHLFRRGGRLGVERRGGGFARRGGRGRRRPGEVLGGQRLEHHRRGRRPF